MKKKSIQLDHADILRAPFANKHLRQGDKVVGISGSFKGFTGTILQRRGDKLIISGLNVRKKTMKSQRIEESGKIIEREMPLSASNFMLAVGDQNKPVKLRVRVDENNERVLYYKDGDRNVDYRPINSTKK